MQKEEVKVSYPKSGKILKKPDEDSDDELYEPEQAIPHFLKNLPGVSATDSMAYRIESLRVHLEN